MSKQQFSSMKYTLKHVEIKREKSPFLCLHTPKKVNFFWSLLFTDYEFNWGQNINSGKNRKIYVKKSKINAFFMFSFIYEKIFPCSPNLISILISIDMAELFPQKNQD